MTRQTLMGNSSVRGSYAETATQTMDTATQSDQSAPSMKAIKTYSTDQQIKFLHLQAEAESLLQHVQAVKQRRQMTSDRVLVQN